MWSAALAYLTGPFVFRQNSFGSRTGARKSLGRGERAGGGRPSTLPSWRGRRFPWLELVLAIGGAAAAFFTFGASLIITAVGIGMTTTGELTAAGAGLCGHLLSKDKLKHVQNALKSDHLAIQELADAAFKRAVYSDERLALEEASKVEGRCVSGARLHRRLAKASQPQRKLGGKRCFKPWKLLRKYFILVACWPCLLSVYHSKYLTWLPRPWMFTRDPFRPLSRK